MRKITLVCVGNLKEKFWSDAIEEYKKRISRFFEFKIVEIAETKLFDKLKKTADKRFGGNENDSTWRAYVYGGFSSSAARILSKNKKKGMSGLL